VAHSVLPWCGVLLILLEEERKRISVKKKGGKTTLGGGVYFLGGDKNTILTFNPVLARFKKEEKSC